MPKKKVTKTYHQQSDKWVHFLSKKNIKVYPEVVGNKFKVVVDMNGKIIFGNELYTTATITDGVLKAVEYLYNKLKDGNN